MLTEWLEPRALAEQSGRGAGGQAAGAPQLPRCSQRGRKLGSGTSAGLGPVLSAGSAGNRAQVSTAAKAPESRACVRLGGGCQP